MTIFPRLRAMRARRDADEHALLAPVRAALTESDRARRALSARIEHLLHAPIKTALAEYVSRALGTYAIDGILVAARKAGVFSERQPVVSLVLPQDVLMAADRNSLLSAIVEAWKWQAMERVSVRVDTCNALATEDAAALTVHIPAMAFRTPAASQSGRYI